MSWYTKCICEPFLHFDQSQLKGNFLGPFLLIKRENFATNYDRYRVIWLLHQIATRPQASNYLRIHLCNLMKQ